MELIADLEKLEHDKPASFLVDDLKRLVDKDTYVYYNFPLYRGDLQEDLRQVEIMMVSRQYGVIYFKCINTYRILSNSEKEYLNDLYENIYSRLSKDVVFRKSRKELNVGLTSVVVICDQSNIYNNTDSEFIYVSLSQYSVNSNVIV